MITERKVTIDRVREILGTKAANRTDKDLQELINLLYSLCDRITDGVMKNSNIKAYAS